MHPIEIVLGIILLICAIFLVVAVLLQQDKQKGLSGSIGGGSDTFFGKTKGKTFEKKLSKATTIIAIVFVIVVAVAFICDGMWDAKPVVEAPATTTAVTTVATEAPATEEATGTVEVTGTEAPEVTGTEVPEVTGTDAPEVTGTEAPATTVA